MKILANDIWKKTAKVLNTEIIPTPKSHRGCECPITDLRGLSDQQLDLVLRLIEQMKKANKEYQEKEQSMSQWTDII